jgi:hypothetical protein
MNGLIEVHVLSNIQGQPYQPTIGTRLLGLDNQGGLWCGFLAGEAGLADGEVDEGHGIKLRHYPQTDVRQSA